MGPRRVTISCPGCGTELEGIKVDRAEDILFNGCEDCQELSS
jgi:hypothetical protein